MNQDFLKIVIDIVIKIYGILPRRVEFFATQRMGNKWVLILLPQCIQSANGWDFISAWRSLVLWQKNMD